MTNLVQFPGLGRSVELDRVAFSIGGADIYWYGVCIAFGLCLALVFAFRRCTEFGIDADAMVDVMRFWLSRGADGFRVDMADSLVKKDDEGKPYTIRTWQYMFARIRPAFPEAAFVSEW